MPRTIVIRIVVDNQDAINNIKAMREQEKLLQDQTRFLADEQRKAEIHAANLAKTTKTLSQNQNSLVESITKGYLIGRGISTVFNGIAQSFTYVISESAKLELSFARVSAVTGQTGASLDKLQNIVYQLSRNTLSSTSEIADAALELSKLGISGENLNQVLSGVVDLSNALGDSLESTGQLVGGIVNTFNLSSDEAAKVADKLFVATGKSASNIQGFKVAFSLAGNVAEEAGVKFEELAAAFAALSNQGIRASTQGTGFRSFIIELSKEGSKAQKALGGSIQELGLLGAMDKLAKLKLDPGSAVDLFGKPAAPVVLGLAKAGEATRSFLHDINDSNDALKESSKIIDNTLIGSVQKLSNAFIELGRSIPTGIVSTFIADLASGLTGYIDEFKQLADFKEFIEKERKNGRSASQDLNAPGAKDYGDLFQAFLQKQNEDKVSRNDALVLAKRLAEQEAQHPDLHKFDKVASVSEDRKLKTEDTLTRITRQFEEFKALGNEFDFSNAEDQLQGLYEKLDKVGQSKQALKVLRELQEIQKENQRLKNKDESSISKSVKDIFSTSEEDKSIIKGIDSDYKSHLKKNEKHNFKKDNEFSVYLLEQSKQIDEFNVKLEATKLGFDALSNASQDFSNHLVNIFSHNNAFAGFFDNFGNLVKQFIADIIAMEIRLLALKALISIFGIATGGAAPAALNIGSAAGAGLNLFAGAQLSAKGADEVITRPKMYIAGEAGPERVKITPLGKRSSNDSSGGMVTNIYVQGDVFNAEKLVDKVVKTNQRSKSRYV